MKRVIGKEEVLDSLLDYFYNEFEKVIGVRTSRMFVKSPNREVSNNEYTP